jgi:outer membrane protein assembly factor BamB
VAIEMNVLCNPRLSYLDKHLYFQTETEDIFGKISSKSGKVFFFDSVPEQLLKESAHCCLMHTTRDRIYVIANSGNDIYEISREDRFSKISCENEDINIETWAGIISYGDKIYAFGREGGQILEIDTCRKKAHITNTNIKDKLMWVCQRNDNMYAVSWDCKHIYRYDLNIGKTEVWQMCLDDEIKFESKSSIPLHGMCLDAGNLYFHDANIILKHDISLRKTSVLWKNENADNGSRIVILNNFIVVPAWNQQHFYLLEKETGVLREKRTIPESVMFEGNWRGNGVPCYTEDVTYLPIVNSDVVLVMNNESAEFEWLKLEFDKNNINRMMEYKLQRHNVVLENHIYNLETFLQNV